MFESRDEATRRRNRPRGAESEAEIRSLVSAEPALQGFDLQAEKLRVEVNRTAIVECDSGAGILTVRDAVRDNGDAHQSRRLRLDELPANVNWSYTRGSPPKGDTTTSSRDERGHSGRWFVLVSGLVLLTIWGTLYLLFRDWRARYQKRRALRCVLRGSGDRSLGAT